MTLKVYDVYNTVNTKPNIFYSAYLKNKVQYNDVDPDKIIVVEEIQPKLEEKPDENEETPNEKKEESNENKQEFAV